MGDTKGGPFDIAGDQASEWLRLPGEPERPDQRRRLEAVAERHGPHPAAVGQVDRRLRVDDVSWRRGALRRSRSAGRRSTSNRCVSRTGAKPIASTGGGMWNRGRACGGRSTGGRATTAGSTKQQQVGFPSIHGCGTPGSVSCGCVGIPEVAVQVVERWILAASHHNRIVQRIQRRSSMNPSLGAAQVDEFDFKSRGASHSELHLVSGLLDVEGDRGKPRM